MVSSAVQTFPDTNTIINNDDKDNTNGNNNKNKNITIYQLSKKMQETNIIHNMPSLNPLVNVLLTPKQKYKTNNKNGNNIATGDNNNNNNYGNSNQNDVKSPFKEVLFMFMFVFCVFVCAQSLKFKPIKKAFFSGLEVSFVSFVSFVTNYVKVCTKRLKYVRIC